MQEYDIPIYKLHLVRDSSALLRATSKRILKPDEAAMMVRRYLAGVDREHLVVLLLDTQLNVTGINTVSVGTIDATLATPREIFKPAILAGAHGIILAHNHPSGDPEPSTADKILFKRIHEAGKLLQIELLDAIIIGDRTENFYSSRRDSYGFAGLEAL